mgnify:CR=1 FL=1
MTSRDILKWCTRMASNSVLTSLTTEHLAEKTRKLVLDEALDVFAGCLPAGRGRMALARASVPKARTTSGCSSSIAF